MTQSSSTSSTEVRQPHEGVHYDNPTSKPLQAPLGKAEQERTQRFVWKLFFILISCVIALGVVLGLVTRH
jgi:hypothetical protein